MAHSLKVLASNPENLSSISGTHIIEGKNQLLEVVLWPP